MVDLSIDNAIYENKLDYFFHEYFEKRGFNIDTDFKEIPNNVYRSAFRYIFKNVFQLPPGKLLFNSLGSYILTDYNTLKYTTLFYIESCEKYNIVSFIENYIALIGMSQSEFYNWNNDLHDNRYNLFNNYYIDNNIDTYKLYCCKDKEYLFMLNVLCMDIFKYITSMGKSTIRGKLSDDRTGLVVLANNDSEIGLEYEQKRTRDRIETTMRSVAELPNLFESLGIETK